MTTPYRPSNGTEGMVFEAHFCDRCARDAGQDCPIHTAALVFDIGEPEYPAEWVEGEGGPACTAFEAADGSGR